MKRYEKMNKEELFKLIGYNIDCEVCPLNGTEGCDETDGIPCMDAIHNYLNEEITPRIAKIHTAEELEEACRSFRKYCSNNDCHTCKYHDRVEAIECFADYLSEEE